jgi:hypothetical protein
MQLVVTKSAIAGIKKNWIQAVFFLRTDKQLLELQLHLSQLVELQLQLAFLC